MDPETMRGDGGDGGGDVYWRRRMSVLIAVLVVVAVVAWACSSGSSGPQRTSSAESSASASPSVDPLLAGLRTLALGTATPTPQPSPGMTTPSASAAAGAGANKPDRPGQLCAEGDLVLSLQGKQDVYTGSAWPNFLVTLVNTGPAMCRADVGPRALEIRITSGEDRIWSTADCVSGPAAEVRELERGIPYVRTLDWDRRRSSEDCRTTPAAALPGTYVAVARMGKLRSPKGVFHLR
ncbi:hypothetical protein [Nonomuraea sp. 3-1Str]|uniref:hypothetical protein n=1 Tax=unclassified Nonomuraea TaxID=2593643 RepID=UPI00285E8925|nr:hypothetical protein [Nonomuraea sp. 3-1Str]MDR8408362.1 hypothetical protein [Nonomuraea sp. 3-1Str]